jgi:hypothetical protein
MLATQLCSRTVSVSQSCLQQLLFSNTRCLCPSLAAARQLSTSRSSCQATGTAGQQSTDGQVAAADMSVLDTVKLLEAGIGPLSQQPMVRINSQTATSRVYIKTSRPICSRA